jgi:hypothetical protein
MMRAVKRTPNTAMADIVNYTGKKRKFLKEQAEIKETDEPQPGTRGPTAGCIPYHVKIIGDHLKKHKVVDTEKGLKFGSKTINVSYDDMMADLTHNYTKTEPHLTNTQQEYSRH